MQVRNRIRSCIATAASCVLLIVSMAAMADGGYHRAVDKVLDELKAAGHSRPIVETHIHFWQVTRPGGVPWPTPAEGPIYRDVLPGDYTAMAKANGILTAGVVEASGIVEDNQWILDRLSATASIRPTSEISTSGRRPSRMIWSGSPKTGAGSVSAAILRVRPRGSRSVPRNSKACGTSQGEA